MEKFEEKIEPKKEKEPEIQRPKFEIEEFEEARESFENLTKELTPAIQRHEYNLIIGDDASGRIPTLVIGGLFKEVYKEDKIDPPQILFFAGGKERLTDEEGIVREISDNIKRLISKNKIDSSKTKALLTTEYMAGGRTMAYFVRTLKETGLSCDIATLSTRCSLKEYKRQFPEFEGAEIHVGSPGGLLHFWVKKELAGVRRGDNMIFTKRREGERELVLEARRNVKKMVNYLKQIYDREKEKTEE